MIEGHLIFNGIIYAIVIAYILYINFAAYYQTTTGFLKALVNIFQNWIFRTVFLLIVGFFALDIFKYGGFVLAILLTIAFLNTNMLMYKQNISERFEVQNNTSQDQVQLHNLPPPPSSVPLSKPSPLQMKDKKLPVPMQEQMQPPMQPQMQIPMQRSMQPSMQPQMQPPMQQQMQPPPMQQQMQQKVEPYNIKPMSASTSQAETFE